MKLINLVHRAFPFPRGPALSMGKIPEDEVVNG